MPDDSDPPAEVGDVRLSGDHVVEWFDGTCWQPYREQPDPPVPPLWIFRGSDDRGGSR